MLYSKYTKILFWAMPQTILLKYEKYMKEKFQQAYEEIGLLPDGLWDKKTVKLVCKTVWLLLKKSHRITMWCRV